MYEIKKQTDADSEFNPLILLGIEPWLIKSFEVTELKRFLIDYRRLMAKYFHPDKNLDLEPLKLDFVNWYFKTLFSSIDKLLADDFYLADCQDQLTNDSTLQEMRSQITRLKIELKTLKQKHPGI